MSGTTSTMRTRALRCVAALIAAVGLAGCGLAGSPSSQLDSVVIGSANFSESQLLAEVYAQALEAEGVEVEQVPNIGAREAYMRSIIGDNPSINVLPEYIGYALEYFNEDIPDTSLDAVKQQLAKDLPRELETLQVSEATDEDAIVVTEQTAQKYNLQSIADLKRVDDQLVAGGSPEFRTRQSGIAGMKQEYGIEFGDYKTLDAAGPLSEEAMANNEIQVSDFFTTQPAIAENNFVILDDPKEIILPGNIVPLIRDDTPQRQTVEKTLNAVSAALTTEKLAEMLRRVDVDRDPMEDVAADFLKQEGLA